MFNKVSSLSMAFKKSVLNSNVEEVKQEHRQNIKALMDDYFVKLGEGKVDGIRNAKELAELIKLDLAILGENTETINLTAEDIKIQQVSQQLDLDDPKLQDALASAFALMNKANDDEHK